MEEKERGKPRRIWERSVAAYLSIPVALRPSAAMRGGPCEYHGQSRISERAGRALPEDPDGRLPAGRQAGRQAAGRQAEKGAKGGSKGDDGLQVDLQGQGQKGKGTDQL